MKKILVLLSALVMAFSAKSQDAEVLECYFYMFDNNDMSEYFEFRNLRDNDTLDFIEFTFKLYSSKSDIVKGKYDFVKFYVCLAKNEVYGAEAYFGTFCDLATGERKTINSIRWNSCTWFTKTSDVAGILITRVKVRYKSGYTAYLDGYPKTSRMRRNDERPPNRD